MPKYNLTSAQDPKTTLTSIKFNLKSCKFGTKLAEKYNSTFEKRHAKGWKQLEIGDHDGERYSSTIYCGGSVSAVDWAPASGNLNFLAVACNSSNHGIKINLTESSKSCVQLYEFKQLNNEKCVKFAAPELIQRLTKLLLLGFKDSTTLKSCVM